MQTSAGGKREGKGRGTGASRERGQFRQWICYPRERQKRGRGQVSFKEQCGREREDQIGERESSKREHVSDQERSENDTAYEMNGSAT